MSTSKPATNLSNSNDDNEKTLGITVQHENPEKLRVQYNPNYILFMLVFINMIGLVTILAYSQEKVYVIPCSIIFLYILFQELNALRPIRCVLDKQTGQFHYTRGNVLGISYNNQAFSDNIVNVSGNIVDITQLEMKRHMGRWKDKFQIILLLKNNERLILSNRTLDIEECQKNTEKIQTFIDSEVPIKAIN